MAAVFQLLGSPGSPGWFTVGYVEPQTPITPPKFNIEPENDSLEDDFPFPVVYSQVPFAVNIFRGVIQLV